uniref:Uncharacterized protein n=1 Tax=Faecalibaculum rodentium TaxID=1702221 RepID=A0A140DSL5_9FIRM|nr:hypothetical protein AALO17_05080 [Faecalibaculum rodentium]
MLIQDVAEGAERRIGFCIRTVRCPKREAAQAVSRIRSGALETRRIMAD